MIPDCAEKNLWIAVLQNAVRALHNEETRERSLKFFNARDGMFMLICSMLDTSPDYLRRGILLHSEQIQIDSEEKNGHSTGLEITERLPGARLIPEKSAPRPTCSRHHFIIEGKPEDFHERETTECS